MTRDDIIRMAREAGIDEWWDSGSEIREELQESLERFAELVAAAEREACAEVCADDGMLWGARYAAKIRARGKG